MNVSSGSLEDRGRGEFLEMPGLNVTAHQASRLWAVDCTTAAQVLEALVSIGFLVRTREGGYFRSSVW